MLRILLLSLALMALPVCAMAQANPDSVKHRNDCRLAEQVLRTGHPAPHTKWAREFIGFCGYDVWGRATAAEVRRLRASQDVKELKEAWRGIASLVDANFFEAAAEIAGDRGASTPARTFALLHLAMLTDPYIVIRYRELPKDLAEARAVRARGGARAHARHCNAHVVFYGGKRPYQGQPLPSDAVARIRELAERVQPDATEPERLRVAASCITGRL